MGEDIAKQIEDAPDRTIYAIYVREWKLNVRLRSWNCGDRADFDAESAFLREHLDEELYSRLVVPRAIAHSLIDADGKPVFLVPAVKDLRKAAREKTLDDVNGPLKSYFALERKGAKPMAKLYGKVCELNALTEVEEEEIEKN